MNAANISASIPAIRQEVSNISEKVSKSGPILACFISFFVTLIRAYADKIAALGKHPEVVAKAVAKVLEVPIAVLKDIEPVKWEATARALEETLAWFKKHPQLAKAVESHMNFGPDEEFEVYVQQFSLELTGHMADAGWVTQEEADKEEAEYWKAAKARSKARKERAAEEKKAAAEKKAAEKKAAKAKKEAEKEAKKAGTTDEEDATDRAEADAAK